MESAAAPQVPVRLISSSRFSCRVQKAVGSSVPIWDHLSAEEKGMIVELKVRRKDGKEAFWMPDAAQSACYHCATPFSIFLRRHHCRLCGHIFCADCLQTTVASVYVEDNATANATSKVHVRASPCLISLTRMLRYATSVRESCHTSRSLART